MLTKHRPGSASRALPSLPTQDTPAALDRRGFLRNSGLAAGGLAAISGLGMATVRPVQAGEIVPGEPVVAPSQAPVQQSASW